MNVFFGRTLAYLIPILVFFAPFATSFFVASAEPGGATTPGGAQTPGGGSVNTGPAAETQMYQVINPLKSKTIEEFIFTIIDIILVFALPIIIFFIMFAGFLYTTARGNVSQIEKAHGALLYALIGGVIVLGAKVIVEVVKGTVTSLGL